MVAYESVAYGSLLRIVAYEMFLFHVLNVMKNEKWKMKVLLSCVMFFLQKVIKLIEKWKNWIIFMAMKR